MGIMVLFPPVSQDKVGYRAYNHSYYQITENSLHCPFFSAMNRQMMVYRYVPWGIHEHKRRLCEGRGDHSG